MIRIHEEAGTRFRPRCDTETTGEYRIRQNLSCHDRKSTLNTTGQGELAKSTQERMVCRRIQFNAKANGSFFFTSIDDFVSCLTSLAI